MRRPRPPQVRASMVLQPQAFTECAAKYFRALYDPFHPDAEGACLPISQGFPSQKFSTSGRSTFHVGANGVGVVAFRPMYGLTSDNHSITWNGNGYLLTAVHGTTAAYSDTEYDIQFLNRISCRNPAQPDEMRTLGVSPYYSGDFMGGSHRSVRLVGAGVRVYTSGALQKIQGNYVVWQNADTRNYVHPDEDSVTNFLRNRNTSRYRITDDNFAELCYTPRVDSDMDFVREIFDYNQIPIPANGLSLQLRDRLAGAIIIEGGDPGSAFSVEYVCHFEIRGPGVPQTASDTDPVGSSAVLSAAPAQNSSPPRTQKDDQSALRAIADTLKAAAEAGGKVWEAMGSPTAQRVLALASGTAMYNSRRLLR